MVEVSVYGYAGVQAWVLSRMRVEIVIAKWRDVVTVKTWINTLEKSRSVRAFEIYVNGDKIMGSVTFGRFSILKEGVRRVGFAVRPY
jgi:acyl-CoA thioesterase FadM